MVNIYDSYWEEKTQVPVFRHYAAAEMVEKGPVLDLGCGDGLFADLLVKKGIDVLAVDYSEVALTRVKEKGIKCKVLDFDGKKMPFKDGEFQTVAMLDVLEHLMQPWETLKEALRITQKNVIISCPNFSNYRSRLEVLFGHGPSIMTKKVGHIQFINPDIMKREIRNLNAKLVDERYVGLLTHKTSLTKPILHTFANLFSAGFVYKIEK
ncbi:MAG: class I SAM-dependent methyltransferase [Planctomycetes bacterium]|nr:class I SAM-dependent methyltransferase [Planctomycetota bacterium]